MECILESYRRYSNHRVTLLAGGVGGARMARALRAVLDPGHLTVVVNVGDDAERYGVHVAPDPDTVLYTLSGIEGSQGWGRRDDTTTVMRELSRFGIDTTFTLGDADLALCMARTRMLDDGVPLSTITAFLADRLGVTDVSILPCTDDELRTWVMTDSGSWLDFQEYFVERGHVDQVAALAYHGSTSAVPAPGVIEAIETCDTLVIAPSNPPLSIWPILAVAEIDGAVRAHPNRVAVSPLFGGRPLKGPADAVMRGVGLSEGTAGILEAYDGLVDRLHVDTTDADDVALGASHGVEIVPSETLMSGKDQGAGLAAAVIARERS